MVVCKTVVVGLARFFSCSDVDDIVVVSKTVVVVGDTVVVCENVVADSPVVGC